MEVVPTNTNEDFDGKVEDSVRYYVCYLHFQLKTTPVLPTPPQTHNRSHNITRRVKRKRIGYMAKKIIDDVRED